MNLLTKTKRLLADFTGGSAKVPADRQLESCQAQLDRLNEFFGGLRHNFLEYSRAVIQTSKKSTMIASDIREFYGRSASRAAAASTFKDSQNSIVDSSVQIFKNNFSNHGGVLNVLDDWLDRMEHTQAKIKDATKVRKKTYALHIKLNAMKEEVTKRSPNDEDFRRSMEEVKLKYERSLAFFKSSRQEIVDEVQGLRKRQFSCLDECMVQLMECQLEFFQLGGAYTSAFAQTIQKYRSKVPVGQRRSPSASPQLEEDVHAAPVSVESSDSEFEDELPSTEPSPRSPRESSSGGGRRSSPEEDFTRSNLRREPSDLLHGFVGVPMEGSVSSSNASANGDHHQDIDLMDHHVGSDDGDIHDDHLNLLNSTSPTDSLHAVFGGTHSEPVSRADSNAAEDLLHGHGHSSSSSLNHFGSFDPMSSSHRAPPRRSADAPKKVDLFDPMMSSAPDLSANHVMHDMKLDFSSPVQQKHSISARSSSQPRPRSGLTTAQIVKRNQAQANDVLQKNWKAQETLRKDKEEAGDVLGDRLDAWQYKNGVSRNIRALLSSLQNVLWKDCKWKAVSLGALVSFADVRKAYRKSLIIVHPDRHQNADAEHQVISERVFQALNQGWATFQKEQ